MLVIEVYLELIGDFPETHWENHYYSNDAFCALAALSSASAASGGI